MRFLIIITICFLSGCKPPGIPVQIQKDIDSVAAIWVPDKREGICNCNLRMLSRNEIVVTGETNFPEAGKDINGYLSGSGLTVYDSIKILPDTSVIKKIWGLVSVSVCNMKKDPSHSSELVSQAIMGTPVKILKSRGSWLLVQTPDYYIGWINDSGIEEMTEHDIADWKDSKRIIYTGKSGDIISDSDDELVVSDIVSGAIVKYIDAHRDHYVIEMPDGRRGRINKRDSYDFDKWCSEIKPEAEKLISFAKSLTGSPYLWGGTSTKMTDCSGFVKTIYSTGGIVLARDASQQYRYGKSVNIISSFDSLQPGDLLFFGHVNDAGEKRITHTGMYIGNTEVIHSSGMVKINSVDSTRTNYSSYLKESVLGARRITGSGSAKGTEHVAGHGWYK